MGNEANKSLGTDKPYLPEVDNRVNEGVARVVVLGELPRVCGEHREDAAERQAAAQSSPKGKL